jgi:hypothetical protein
MRDESPSEESDTAQSARAERLRSRAPTLAVAAAAVLLGGVLEVFVVPHVFGWWTRVVLYPYRGPISRAVAGVGLGEWWAGQFSMLSIHIVDYATALAVGTGIGLGLRARSRLVAAACGIGMIATGTVASLAFATIPDDPRVAATLIGWDLAVVPALLIGEILGRRLRRPDPPPSPRTEASSSLAEGRST